MHKRILALVISGLASGWVSAQSNVTMYGLVDVGYNNIRTSGKPSQNSIDSSLLSGSRLGFKGTEDLGGGLKALFVLEYALSNDTNSALGADSKWSASATRQSYVGVSNDKYGTVVGGRLQGAAFKWACTYSPLTGGIFGTDSRLGARTNLDCGDRGRSENAVGYISPEMAGFTVELNHVRLGDYKSRVPTNEVPNAFANVVGVTYRHADLQVGAVYNAIHNDPRTSSPATLGKEIREFGIGAAYDFKVVKLYATYANNKVEGATAQSKYQIGAAVPVSAKGSVVGSYAANKLHTTDGDSKVWSVAYLHELSKRTTLYAGYGQMNNQANATTGMGLEASTPGGSSSVVAAGVRHSF